MSPLAQLQRQFQAYVMSGDPLILPEVVAIDASKAQRRLDIYHQAYRLRLIEVLGNDFPGVKALAGEHFTTLLQTYVEASPSPHFNVRWYGDRLAGFLAGHADAASTPALAEMAALEWDLTLVFDAVEEALVELADVGQVPPDAWATMRLSFASSLRCRVLHWNVAQIRRAMDQDEPLPTLAPLESAETEAIWRHDFKVRHRPLAVDEAAALNAARDGATFSDLCVLLCEWHAEDTVAMRAAELLKNWIHDQWVAALIAEPVEPA